MNHLSDPRPSADPRIKLCSMFDPERFQGQGKYARDLAPGDDISCRVIGDRNYHPGGRMAVIQSNVPSQDGSKRLVTLWVHDSPPIIETHCLDADSFYLFS